MPKGNKKKSKTLRVSDEAYEAIDLLSHFRRVTISDVVESLLDSVTIKAELAVATKLEQERKKAQEKLSQ